MNTKNIFPIIIAVILLITGLIIMFPPTNITGKIIQTYETYKVINYLEKNNIKILLFQDCLNCMKQRQEFGSHFENMKEKGIIIMCEENGKLCRGKWVPNWSKNSTTLTTGHIPLNEIIDKLEKAQNLENP